ncbi:hypothetical protein [Stenotrophomonas acidaminiphila]|uniref:hypothetical protein n=1 Tax=Stenotrophomonas acidaminiphila TaxID=128780 RepID=UPI0028B0C684|nr:hypothetical protein [Stenotrophomonas acidaminiphila]
MENTLHKSPRPSHSKKILKNIFEIFLSITLIFYSISAKSQIYTFEVYEKEIDRLSKMSPLPEFGEFGDSVDMSSGNTTFRKTLIEIKGSNDLRVAADYIFRLTTPPGGIPHFTMASDIAYIEGTHSSELGWIAGHYPTDYNTNRCSDPRALSPLQGAATIRILKPVDNIVPADYWSGNTLYVPGEQGGFVRPISTNESRPSGVDIKWAVNGEWRFSCYTLPDGSEGFVGHRANGQKYYFGIPVAQQLNAQLLSPNRPDVDGWLDVDKFRMYVVRIEDRFGNWVNYSNEKIISNDGRFIIFSKSNSNEWLINATGRQWTINHNLNPISIFSITNPDGSKWEFSQTGTLRLIESTLHNSCSSQASIPHLYSGQLTAAVKTESGATGTFLLQPRRRGYSNVRFDCNYAASGHKEGMAYSKIMHFIDEISLISRTTSGPGTTAFTHNFDYGPISACYDAKGDPNVPDACTTNSPTTRTTTLTGPNGSIKTFTFGNTYHVNAGLMLATSHGGFETSSIEYATLYSDSNGAGMTPLGFDMNAYQINRIKKSTLIRQGTRFTLEIPATCGSGQFCFDEYFRPTKIVRSSNPLP